MPPNNQPAHILRLQIGHGSDPGRQRSLNEDCYGIAASQVGGAVGSRGYWHVVDKKLLAERGQLFVVADGIGGHNAGELASELAVKTILHEYYRLPFVEPGASLRQAIGVANREILSFSQAGDPALKDMGTTVTALVVRGNQATVLHLGDSRCYLINQSEVSQPTQDHTWVHEQRQAGLLTDEEALRHPYRHVLSRSLGRGDVEPEALALALATGDRLVLCSDGLSNLVAPHELHSVVMHQPPQAAVEQLLALANQRGGPDNITAVVVQIEQMTEPAAGGVLAAAPAQVTTLPRRWLAAGVLGIVAMVCAALFAVNGLTGLGSQPTPTPTRTPSATQDSPLSTTVPAQPTSSELPAGPTPAPASSPVSSPTEDGAQVIRCEYYVQQYDNLEKIAKRFDLSEEHIIDYNGGSIKLHRGNKILLPVNSADITSGKIHRVQADEGLIVIAQRYGIESYEDLAEANGLEDANRIKTGHCLVIPR